MPVLSGRKNNREAEITHSKILLVEGKDEVVFFEALLKKIEVAEPIQIITVGGTSNFKNELLALIGRTGFTENVKSIGVVRDADLNFDAAFRSICGSLENAQLNFPDQPNTFTEEGQGIRVGIFIMPGDEEHGTMLEDLCLRTQAENPIMECVDSFFACLPTKTDDIPSNIAKAKVQVFLAAMPKLVNTLGLGAQKKYWDLDHPCLYELNTFLQEL